MTNKIEFERESTAMETIQIGDSVYAKDSVTPSVYFDYVKGLKKKLDYEEYDIIIDTTLKLLRKTEITGQVAMAKELTHQLELAIRELDAAKDGFDIFVYRKDIEKYIDQVESKAIKIIDLENYERDIPDDIIDKIGLAKKHFDKLYIVFTDYTKKETKKVAKARRDKDPIMFGAFHDKDNDESTHVYIEDRMFFIADWVEEKCDLTLEEMVRDVKDKTNKDITYRVSLPKDEEAVKNMLKSYKDPESIKPVSLFEKIKKKITKSTTTKKKTTTRKKKTEVTE